ncbi:MAG: ribosome recycling factor [Planctomycetota bacterium]|jgi:ribosome recycling factor
MSVKDIVDETKQKMNKTVELIHDELKSVRTSRASTGLVENIKVDYYGTPTPLKQIAALATPQPDMIVIKPFDPGSSKQIEAAIKTSNLSMAPILDGKLIRLNVPPLSEERRNQLQGQVKQIGEQAKVSIRNIRRDANKHLEGEQKDKVITEDDLKLGKKQVDDLTKEHTDDIDKIIRQKNQEVLSE